MEDDYLLDYEEAKKLAKWNRILDEVEEWIVREIYLTSNLNTLRKHGRN